ncbi:hypothetical protein OAF50_02185 [bacterium]|nr:hypothetical protein [bacterium]
MKNWSNEVLRAVRSVRIRRRQAIFLRAWPSAWPVVLLAKWADSL